MFLRSLDSLKVREGMKRKETIDTEIGYALIKKREAESLDTLKELDFRVVKRSPVRLRGVSPLTLRGCLIFFQERKEKG